MVEISRNQWRGEKVLARTEGSKEKVQEVSRMAGKAELDSSVFSFKTRGQDKEEEEVFGQRWTKRSCRPPGRRPSVLGEAGSKTEC